MDIVKTFLQDRYLVINADDFGLSSNVNKGILKAHERGLLTSTSLMANGPMFQQGVEMSRSAPRLGVGVHVNLVRGKPISEVESVTHLVDERGLFPGKVASIMHRLLRSPIALDQAEKEILAQIEYVTQAGICPTHVDSEKHLHMYPPLFERLAKAATYHGIRWIRVVDDNAILWKRKPTITQVVKASLLRIFALRCRKKAEAAGLMVTDFFYGVLHAGHMVKEIYDDIFEKTSGGVTEIVCHPGFEDNNTYVNPEMGPYFLAANRQDELDALLDETLIHKLRSLRIKLTNFGDMP